MRPAEDHKVFLSAALYNQSRSAWKTACHKYCGNIYMAQLCTVQRWLPAPSIDAGGGTGCWS